MVAGITTEDVALFVSSWDHLLLSGMKLKQNATVFEAVVTFAI